MRITLANVKFSPNLGDGLLCECLEKEIRSNSDDIDVESVDLAGRTDYGSGDSSRRLKMVVLEALPKAVRTVAAEAVLRLISEFRLRKHWRTRLSQAEAFVVGGGNLFADADLNFPIKINVALQEATRRGVPVAVFGVGVSKNWTARGKNLFETALADARVVQAMVRDEGSRHAWDEQLRVPSIVRAGVTSDPGVLTFRHFARPARAAGMRRIGLGLTDPLAVRYHGGSALSEDFTLKWLAALVGELARQNFEIMLFTNGSPEDRGFLERGRALLEAQAPNCVRTEGAFRTPADLAGFIGSCDLVLAHRMHACIAAYSYRVPTIGFAWDLKLDSFFELTGRPRYIVDLGATEPIAVAALAQQALMEGIDATTHQALVDRCRGDVRRLIDRLRTSIRELS